MQYRLSKHNVSVHKAGNALEKDRHHRFGAFDEESDVGRALGGESWPRFLRQAGWNREQTSRPAFGMRRFLFTKTEGMSLC